MKEKLLALLRERSPQTTLELAKKLKASWHIVQENLLELHIDNKVSRMIVGKRHLWFIEENKKSIVINKKSMTGLKPVIGLSIVIVAFLLLSTMIFGLEKTEEFDSTQLAELVELKNTAENIALNETQNKQNQSIIVNPENSTFIDEKPPYLETNKPPVLVRNIDDIILYKDQKYTLDLSNYFHDDEKIILKNKCPKCQYEW